MAQTTNTGLVIFDIMPGHIFIANRYSVPMERIMNIKKPNGVYFGIVVLIVLITVLIYPGATV
jgi:hypothetical protein